MIGTLVGRIAGRLELDHLGIKFSRISVLDRRVHSCKTTGRSCVIQTAVAQPTLVTLANLASVSRPQNGSRWG
jgi:hypothetical protein